MFILKKGHQPGVYVPLRALFLVHIVLVIELVDIALNYLFMLPWFMNHLGHNTRKCPFRQNF